MTLIQMRAYVKKQAKKLKISHWDIKVKWMSEEELKDWPGSCYATVEWVAANSTAVIYVNPFTNENLEDYKNSLTHELLHVRIEGGREMTLEEDIPLENAICALADILK